MSLKHIPSLDGFRGVACLIVLLAHMTPLYVSGAFGVDMFFVLSGFLITGILVSEIDKTGRIALLKFYVRRFLRLLPALWLTVIAVLGTLYFVDDLRPEYIREAIYAVTYISNWIHALGIEDRYFLGHTWSLAIEEQFYIIWPFALLLLTRCKLGHGRNALVLASLALFVAIYRNIPGYDDMRIYRGLDTHCDGLLLGSALAYFLLTVQAKAPALTKLLPWAAYPACLILLTFPIKLGWTHWPTPLFGYAVINMMSCIVIWEIVTHQQGPIARVLSLKPLTYSGKISYGLYLYHWPIVIAARHLLPDAQWYVHAAIAFPAAYIVSDLSFRFIESRFLAMKRHFA
ncbi:acyltransferase family protein [Mucisphaera sp.]|uniref:acyltransferase family protein n=1 Tax=Mucisphaera sp. TaxID=2913024 RepID=UPI003D12E71B